MRECVCKQAKVFNFIDSQRSEWAYYWEPVEEVVRCRDCKHYYEAEGYHPKGNYVMRCCKYFDTYNDEVEPDGFCKWGERKE